MSKIIVQTLGKKKITVNTELSVTVLQFKEKMKEHNFNPINTKIIYKGKILDNTKTLESYGITDGTDVVIMESKKNEIKDVVKKPVIPAVIPTTLPPLEINSTVPANVPPVIAPAPVPEMPQLPNNINPQNMQILFSNFMNSLMQDPEINSAYQRNPEAFMQTINNPNFMNVMTPPNHHGHGAHNAYNHDDGDSSEDNDSNDDGIVTLRFTKQEKNEIDELVAMGFEESEVIEVYIACEKNKEKTANMEKILLKFKEKIVAMDICGLANKSDTKTIKLTAEIVKTFIRTAFGIKEKRLNVFTENSSFLICRPLEQNGQIFTDVGWYILQGVSMEDKEKIMKQISTDSIISIEIDGEDYLVAKTTVAEQQEKSFYTATDIKDMCLFPDEKNTMVFELLNKYE